MQHVCMTVNMAADQIIRGESHMELSDEAVNDSGMSGASSVQYPESSASKKIESTYASSRTVTVMLERVAHSEGHFKHQQRGEPDLTFGEKLEIATQLFDTKPGTFLTRFGKFLEAEDLINFEPLSNDYIIAFQLKEIRTRLNVSANQMVVKNRRYEAMKQLVEQGEYFDDELLKQRDPLLYEQMIGQHLDSSEINSQVNKSDLRFSTILLSHLDIIRNNELYKKQKEIEAANRIDDSDSDNGGDDEESDDESEIESEDEAAPASISAEEKKMLRDDFLTTMKQRFLNGEDVDFDYTEVDTNENYDSLDIREHDEQERYFDKEEPEIVDMEPVIQVEETPPSTVALGSYEHPHVDTETIPLDVCNM